MTSVTNPGNYVDFDEYVGLKLEKTRSTIRTTDLLTAVAGVAAMFLGYLLIFVVLDQWVIRDGFGVFWRWTLLSTLMICTIAWLVWKVGIPSFRTVNGLFAAQEIEKSEPELKSNLLNLVDLKAAGRSVNPAILRAIERQAAVRLQQVDVAQAIDHRPLVRSAYVLLAIIVAFCFYAMLSPKKISNSIWRAMLPAAQVPLATITEILDVKPGDITVPAHQPFVEVQVDLAGEIPQQVLLLYSTADGKHDQPLELRPEQEGQPRFRGQLIGDNGQGMVQELTYFIRAGDATSKQYKISVEQPPYADVESVRIEFPSYMKLQPVEQINNGAVDAWEGAKVVVNAKTNMPIRSGMIQFLDDPQVGPTGEEVLMSVTAGGRQLQATWTLALRTDGTFPKCYRIHCRTEDGRVTTGHVINPLTIRPDMPPEAMLLQPDRDLDAPANATIPLLVQARDPDFELGYVYLNVEKAGQKIVHEQLSEGRQSKLMLRHELALGTLNPAVGDTLEIWIEAYDNKQPRPNSRNTPKVKIRVAQPVSPKEAEQQLAEQNQRRDQKLAEADLETNPDRPDAAPPMDDDSKNREKRDIAQPNDADPKQQQQDPQNDPTKDGQQDQPGQADEQNSGKKSEGGNSQNKSGQSSGSQKNGTNQNEPENRQAGQESKPNKSLNNDGSQDDEAIRRISEQLNKNNSQKSTPPTDQPSAEKTEPPQPAREETQPNQPSQGSKSQSGAEKGSTAESQKQKSPPDKKQKGGGDTENAANNDPSKNPSTAKSEPDSAKPSTDEPKSDSTAAGEKKKDQKSPDGETQNDKGNLGADPKVKPAAKPEGSEKSDAAENNSNQPAQEPEKKSKGENGAAPDAKQKVDPDQPQGQSPKKSDDKGSQSSQADKPQDKKSQDAGNSKSDVKKKPEAGEKGSDQNPQEQKSADKPNDSTDARQQEPTGDKKGGQGKKDDNNKSDSSANPPSGEKGGDGNKSASNSQQPSQDDQPSGTQADKKPRDQTSDSGDKNGGQPDSNGEKPGQGEKSSTEKTPSDSKPAGQKSSEDKSAGQGAAKSDGKADDGQARPGDDKNDGQGTKKPASQPSDAAGQKPDAADGKKEGAAKSDDGPRPDSPANSQPSDKNSDTGKSTPNKKDAGSGDDSSKTSPTDKKSPGKPSRPDGKASSTPASTDEKPSADQDDKPSSDPKKTELKSKKKDGEANNEDGPKSDSQANPKNEKKGGDKSRPDSKESGKGESKSPDSSGAPADKKPGDAGNKGGKDGKGGTGDKPGAKSEGKPSDAGTPSSKPGSQNSSNGQGSPSGSGDGTATTGGDSPEAPRSDDANLEYNRQATELILQKLKKDLERGDVDPELLEQLGWTPAEMKRFADRLSKSLQESKGAAETPETQARQQQFQEMLKNLDLKKSGTQRSGEKEPKRDLNQIESKRTPPPSAYGKAFEKFTRDLNRQKTPAADKPTK